MLLGPLIQRARLGSTRFLGIEERTLLISVMFGGVCVSALYLILGQPTLARLGVVGVLAGIDGMILSVETRAGSAI